MILIDASIPIDGQRLCLIGWSDTGQTAEAWLVQGESRIDAAYSTRFRRSDLTGARELGYFLVFDLPPHDPERPFQLQMDGDPGAVPVPLEPGNWLDFLRVAVDEAFAEIVFAWQQDIIGDLEGDAQALLAQRLSNTRQQEMRTAETAISVENAVANGALGFGILSGWHVTNSVNSDDLVAMIVDDGRHIRFPILTKCHLREDLAPYSDTYVMTGADGFSGRFSLTGLTKIPEVVLILVRDAVGCHILSVPVVQVTRDRLAGLMLLLRGSARKTAVGALLRPELTFDLSGLASGRTLASADVNLLLDHDAADADLREVLRCILRLVPGRLNVSVLRDFESPVLRDAMAGALADDTEGRLSCRVAGRSPNIGQLASGGATMLYGRSSCLVQFVGWPELLDAVGRDGDLLGVMLHDPLLERSTLDEHSIDCVRVALNRNAPFVAVFGQGLAHAAANLVQRMMTIEGGLRVLAYAMAKSDLPSAFMIDAAPNYFEGMQYSNAEVEAQNVTIAQGFDAIALSATLIDEA